MDQIEKQKRLETDAIEEGLARYYRKQAGSAPAQSKPGAVLLQDNISPLATAIRAEQEALCRNTGQPGSLPKYALPLLSVDPDKLAFITLGDLLHFTATRGIAGKEVTATHAALVIGKRCRLERHFDSVQGRARNVGDLVLKRNKDKSNAPLRALQKAQEVDDWVGGRFGNERDVQLGIKLIDLALKHTALVERDTIETKGSRGQHKTPEILRLTDNAQESLTMPVHLPMIVPPRPRTSPYDGGYLIIPTELVKHRDNPRVVEELEGANLSCVLSAVNALQETPWRINRRIYQTIRRAWEAGKGVGGLPRREQQTPGNGVPPPEATGHRVSSNAFPPRSPTPDQVKELLFSEELLSVLRRERRFTDYAALRTRAELLLALEECGTLDCTTAVTRIVKSLARSGEDSAGVACDKAEAVLHQLVEYRLYEDMRGGQRPTLPDLERCGLVRIEYAPLTKVCNDDTLWRDHVLWCKASPEQREHVAVELLSHMRRYLAINAQWLQADLQPKLKKQVQETLKEPWILGKRGNLSQAKVFIGPELHPQYPNEKSLAKNSYMWKFLSDEGWSLSEDEYISLIVGLLWAMQKGGLLQAVRIAAGQPGFQIQAGCLRWVKPEGSAPQPHPPQPRRSSSRPADAQHISDLAMMRLRIDICEKLVNEEHLYFPHQLDYRGRAYPIPQVFNPQSGDIGRALLEFADGKPLGQKGAYWLAVHLANTYGYDKVPFDERVTWVEDHEAEIRDSAENPLNGRLFWADEKEVDEPWCFLAACFEWVDYLNHSRRPDFESRLPIAMDGTCNGLQHLSAMGRDLEGGKHTNLVPGLKPADIYQEVAIRVIPRVQKDAAAGKAEARFWSEKMAGSEKIARKVVKRGTMTTPYGVKPAGIREQLIDDGFTAGLEDLNELGDLAPILGSLGDIMKWDRQRASADYLTSVLTASIGGVVVEAKVIMRWMQRIARILAEEDRGICWTTMTGFPVVVEHREYESRRIRTAFGRPQIYDLDKPLKLRKDRQKSTIAPNFVHSLDAAHMMNTVNRLHGIGLSHFAMIHDSYGVHACDVGTMNRLLREEFVNIHRQPVLARFLAEQRDANPEVHKLPRKPPPQGCLDLKVVLSSEYFFS